MEPFASTQGYKHKMHRKLVEGIYNDNYKLNSYLSHELAMRSKLFVLNK